MLNRRAKLFTISPTIIICITSHRLRLHYQRKMEMETDQELTDEPLEKLLLNILQKCRREAESNTIKVPLKSVVERVSFYTDVPKDKLQEILNKNKSENMSSVKFADVDTYIIVLKHIAKLYSLNKFPTYELLHENIQHDVVVENIKEFTKKLALFGIHYRTILNSSLLIEDADCAYERYIYLDKIKKLRAKNANIYYVDERLIEKSIALKKPWQESISTAHESNEYLLLYAISKTGYKTGLFCNKANEDDFCKWIVDILLRQIEPSSVIVFDNNPLHGTLKSKSISMYSTKQDMIKCLLKHNVPYNNKLSKMQLYDLIKKFVTEEEVYSVDQIIKANGHEVLRLPTNLPQLSPIHLMWSELRKSLKTPLLDPLIFEIKDEIHAQLVAMPKNIFTEFDKNIEQKENLLFEIHSSLEKAQDNLISNMNSNAKTE